jgi:D-amino-acid oxidase
MAWLTRELADLGVSFATSRIESLHDVDGDAVVNCTGLGARRLCRDNSMKALLGQVVITQPGEWSPATAAIDDNSHISYVIPRRDSLVLGGISRDHDPDQLARPSELDRTAILLRLAASGHGTPLHDRAALRPWRPAVRVEQDGRIIHNYGHGGAGWTLSWGCAQDVLRLIASRT